jgi:hypothetical protein
MTTSIAIILVAFVTIINSVAIFFSERRYQQSKNGFLSDIPITQREARIFNDEINKLKDQLKHIQPYVDKYKQEQRQERRQKHWRQYNYWKHKIDNLQINGCPKCFNENLSISVIYDNDYPVQAGYHCDGCYHTISKWEYKEDYGC